MVGIEAELTSATKIKIKKGEGRQAYLTRLKNAVQDLDGDEWEGLSSEAQQWCNDATRAGDKDVKIRDFTVDEEKAPATAKKGKAPAVSVSAMLQAELDAKMAARKPKKPRVVAGPMSMRKMVKTLMVKNPTMTVDDLVIKLRAAGHNPTLLAIHAIRWECRDTMRVLRDAGLLDIEL